MSAPYLGDFTSGDTVDFFWSTSDSNGASITRATDGTVYCYKGTASGTEVTTGITDTEDFDSLTGVHAGSIDTSDAFYATGENYAIVLKAATIDGQTVNAVLAHFSIENRISATYKTDIATAKTNTDEIGTAGVGLTAVSKNFAMLASTAQGGTVDYVVLNIGASSTDDIYNGARIQLTGGTGAGQSRVITAYSGTSKIATVDSQWKGAPDITTEFEVHAADVKVSDLTSAAVTAVQSGLATAADLSTTDSKVDTLSTDIDAIDTKIDDVIGPLDSSGDTINEKLGNTAGISLSDRVEALNDISISDVNDQVADVIKTDTTTLPGQEAPPLNPTMEEMVAWIYKVLRNRTTQTATTWSLYADDEMTQDAKATVSDDGTTAIKQEIVAGS